MGSGGRLEVRGRGVRFGLTVSAVVLAAGAAAVGVWPHAWPWLAAVTVIAAAGIPPGLSALSAAQLRRADAEKVTRQGLQGTTGLALPHVEESAELDARVHRAVLPIPYIRRDVEDAARGYLKSGRPVLLVGSSMVGKTQMAVTLIRGMFAGRGIAIPDSMDALAALDAAGVALRGSVIFLDDIDRMVGSGGITDGSLRRLAAAGNVLVGTIRAAEYDRYQPTSQLRPPEWDVLSVFERVFVGRKLSEAEEDRLTGAVSDRDVQKRIIRTGLGEYVGAAEHIEETLRLGPSVSPAGYALVLGAADWRRAGMSAPVPAAVLPVLAAPHLTARDRAGLADGQSYDEALRWATRDINPTVALLVREESGCFAVFDYALDFLSREADPIPEASWPVLIKNAVPADLISIGYTAEVTYHQSSIALQAWRKAADSGHSDAAPIAAFNLGVLFMNQGDADGARVAFQLAIDSQHADAGPRAALNLGVLLREQGDADGARAAYQLAIDSQHAHAGPRAATTLGLLLEDQGDADGARAAFQLAIDSQHADAAAMAALNLGLLLRKQGDADGARAAYQLAIDSQHAHAGPRAALNLGVLLREQGDADGARTAYQLAIDSQHADAAAMAALNLGLLLMNQGDADGARAAFQLAIDSQHADAAAMAALSLGLLLREQGDADGARAAFQLAIDSQHADAAAMAALNLGLLLREQGDADGARAAFQLAIDSQHADAAAIAALSLGVLLREQGDADGARAAFQLAIDSQHADAGPRAALSLGVLLMNQGDADGARTAYQLAIDSQHADAAAMAALNLGVLLEDQGDADGARAAYQLAIDSQHADEAPRAATSLGLLLREQGDADGARAAFQLAIDSQHADAAAMAALSLGVLLMNQGDADGARAAYQLAIDSQHADIAPVALRQLEELHNPTKPN